MGDNLLKRIYKMLTSRLLILFIMVIVMFSMLVRQLFELQIINGADRLVQQRESNVQELKMNAPRGEIFDRYGRPLAVNKVVFSLKIDDSVENKNRTEMLVRLVELLEKNGEKMLDELPISIERPYTFLFNGNKKKEDNWKMEFEIPGDKTSEYDAESMMVYLRNYFSVPNELTMEQARKVLNLRVMVYEHRFRKYDPITVALGISSETIAEIEERNDIFPGLYVDAGSLREYPQGELFSHILGYIRPITGDDLDYYTQYGYAPTDIVGKLGIEKSMEFELRGQPGKTLVEVENVLGRRLRYIDTEQPIPGNNIYLTIDAEKQRKVSDILVNTLTKVLIAKLEGTYKDDYPITAKDLFMSMVSSNNVYLDRIWASPEGSVSNILKQIALLAYDQAMAAEKEERDRIREMRAEQRLTEELTPELEEYLEYDEELDGAYVIPELNINNKEAKTIIKQALANAIDKDEISGRQMLYVLNEQGTITLDDTTKERLERGHISVLSVIIDKLRSGEITPQMTNLDPSTGSVSVLDVKTGEALALVTYPTYDNNELVNNFNNQYYRRLEEDPTSPLINRPLMQKKPPGSTFKMVTAFAGLEEGLVTPTSTIADMGEFTKAGWPYAKCWIYGSSHSTHGYLNVVKALEVSCNYFFYETSYNLNSLSTEDRLVGINKLNKYAEAFGLSSPTGVEIEEYESRLSSPEYKEIKELSVNPDATSSQTRWTDGDTIRTAIGQSLNNFDTTHMAKYVATIASGGIRYQTHLVDKIMSSTGKLVEEKEPYVEADIGLSPENVNAVKQGMLAVTSGANGTTRTVFSDYDIKIAGKSGTAQEKAYRSNHTWFVCFAPYDDPQIAISVLVPFGDSGMMPAAVIAREIAIEFLGSDRSIGVTDLDNVLVQ